MGTNVNISPTPMQRFVDGNGNALAGGLLFTYQAGTTTKTPTYTDDTGNTQNTNPIVLNQRGEASIWLPPTQVFKYVLAPANDTDPPSSPIWTQDGIVSPSPVAVGNMVDELGSDGHPGFKAGTDFTPGTTATLQLSNNYGSAANLWIAFDADEQGADTYSLNGKTLTFTAAIPNGVNKVFVKGGTTLSISSPSAGSVIDASVATGSKLYNRITDFVDIRDPAYGAKCDGVTDDTAAVNLAIAAAGSNRTTLIIPGPTLFSATLTFNPNTTLWFLNGGMFQGKVGTEVVNVQSTMSATLKQIFKNCAPAATVGMTVYPEWFGAAGDGATDDRTAIQSAINFLVNVGGIVQFDAHTYLISNYIQVGTGAGSNGQNTVLQGKGQHSTFLKTTGGAVSAIQVIGASTSPLQGVSIREMSVDKTVASTGGVGITLQYTALCKLRDVQVSNHLLGVSMLGASNTQSDKVTVAFSGSANNWRGFDINGGGANVGGNKSAVFRDCYVDGTQATGTGGIGFYAYGAYVSDLGFYACETAEVPIGYEFDMSASANTGNEDVQLINCRSDGVSTYGIFVNAAGGSGSSDSMVTVIGGWYNSLSTGAEVDLIYLSGCQGITVMGAQLYGAAGAANLTQIKAVNCQGCKFLGNTHREFKYGVYMSGGSNNLVKNSDFYCSSGTPATQMAVGLGEQYSGIDDCAFRGYGTNGAVFDGTSTSCGIRNNSANPANITTRYSNSSGGTPYTVNNLGA